MSELKIKYFVLKPKSKTVEDLYAEASRRAMMTYADTIEPENSRLADELRQWVVREEREEFYGTN